MRRMRPERERGTLLDSGYKQAVNHGVLTSELLGSREGGKEGTVCSPVGSWAYTYDRKGLSVTGNCKHTREFTSTLLQSSSKTANCFWMVSSSCGRGRSQSGWASGRG